MLLTSSGRVRIGSLGVADTLGAPPSSREELQQQQREDLAVRRPLATENAVEVGRASKEAVQLH